MSLDPDQTTTENAATSFTKRTTETVHTSRIMQPATYAVKRYALLRGMLSQSRFEKDHDEKKDGNEGKMSQNKARRQPKRSTYDTMHLDQEKNKPWTRMDSFSDSKTVYGSSKAANVGSRNDDSCDKIGTQFPKRIYIREVSNGAFVDEIVDVQNERDWEVLNYMSPLRHISCGPHERSQSLKFRDLKNFDVYYYPHPWR
ncbi:uncharacterized protein LOC111329948 [Stylophora pistillata]|uniref:uncharacterized protein LOC111329948 n=1 Tax=Stylophora pistillata TaxID=50429 RepID=UPI000C0458E7|nr:uncharacterized protein LOC111329948 [Stylophora pistillata]